VNSGNKDDKISYWRQDSAPHVSVQPKPSRGRRLIKYMTQPGRIAIGIPIAWIITFFTHHQVSESNFWWAYLAWTLGGLIWFFIREIRNWADGQ
jgi:hypothetical protein